MLRYCIFTFLIATINISWASSVDNTLTVGYFQGDVNSTKQLTHTLFTPTRHAFNLDIKHSVTWIKLTVRNITDRKQTLMLFNHFAYLSEKSDLFDANNLTSPLSAYYAYYAYSPVDNEQFIANIWQQTFELAGKQSRTFYLRQQSISSQYYKFSLHQMSDSANQLANHNTLAVFIIAFLLALAFYNLALYLYGEPKALLYYFLYLLNGAVGLAYLYGLLFQFSDNHRHWLSWFNVTAIMVPAFLALYTKFTLDIKRYSSTASNLLTAVIIVCIINLSIAIIFGLSAGMKLIPFSFLFSFIVVIVVSRKMLLKDHPLIKIFIWAYCIYMIGMGLTIAGLYGLLTYQAYQFHASGIGLAIEAILFSYLLHYRSELLQCEVTRQVQLQKELKNLVEYDELTQVATRRAFENIAENILQQTMLKNSRFSLMFIDIDGFKQVNDSHGHQVGDIVLQNVAKKMQSNLRHSDVIARVGGDEFVILLPDMYSKNDLKKISNGLLKKIKEPIDGLDVRIDIGISIGISIYPEHGNTIEQLILSADKAMYQVKQQGKNNWKTFNSA